jgi:ubiquinone/menaquinone biosynthesis C-methylase UbiE
MLREVGNEINHGEGATVLDAGCGTGNLSELLSMNPGIKVVGIDSSESMLQIARTKLRNNMTVTLKNADLNCPLEFGNETFNYVVLTNVLYALRNPLEVLEDIHRILKPGGKLVIVNPVCNPKILKIYREHCVLNPNLLSNLSLFFNLLLVGLLNTIIVKKGKKKQFYFLKEEELVEILQQNHFKSINTRLTYSEQAIMVTAIK